MRKLLSLTCIVSLLSSLASPAFATPNATPPSETHQISWGTLKNKYDPENLFPDRRELIEKSIQDNPYLNSPEIVLVQKLGPAYLAGYVAVGFTSGVPFVTFVDGNYHSTDTFIIDEYYPTEFSNFKIREVQDDGDMRKIVLEGYVPKPDRTHLQTEGILDDAGRYT